MQSKATLRLRLFPERKKVSDGRRIRKNESYPFRISIVQSLAGSEVDCFSFDEKTTICKEPEAELALADNLNGLNFIEK